MEILVSSALSASVIRDRLVGGGAKKLSSVLGRFVVVMLRAKVYLKVWSWKYVADRVFAERVMLDPNRISLTRSSLNTLIVLRGRRDQEIDDVKLLSRLRFGSDWSEMCDPASRDAVRASRSRLSWCSPSRCLQTYAFPSSRFAIERSQS